MSATCAPQNGQSTSLGSYLKACRKSVPAGAKALGSYQRLSNRVGRNVTQEEMAEALGVSRVWYATVESGAARSSWRLLERIADVFAPGPQEMLTLLSVSFPELNLPC